MTFVQRIKECLIRLVLRLIRIFGLNNAVVLEMEPKTDSTLAVYQEMLRRSWNKRYRIILLTANPDNLRHLRTKGVSIIRIEYSPIKVVSFMKHLLARMRAVLVLYQFVQMGKKNPETILVYLTHGSPVKSVRKYYNCSRDVDYMLNQSDFWKPINSYELNISEEKLVTLGSPRNDILFSDRVDMKKIFGKAYSKIVVWYPTYRQASFQSPYRQGITIPVIHDPENARRVNELAAKYDILVVVKPHPVQDISKITALNLDHLILISNSFFVEHGIQSYEFLAKTDALITDYSSVFFDYLLTGKPVALTLEDYELYRKQIGFAIDMNLMKSCSTILDDPEDFDAFFRDLTEGRDPLQEKRREITQLTNKYLDDQSTKRVVDWLGQLLGE